MSNAKKEKIILEMAANIPNLGPVSCRMLYDAGIHSAEDFFGFADAKDVFWKLWSTHGPETLNANLMYSIDAALRNETWFSLPQERKDHWKAFLAQVKKSL